MKLKFYRQKFNLSLLALSNKSGLTPSYICELEKGTKTNPTLDTLEKLANALGVSIADLLEEEAL